MALFTISFIDLGQRWHWECSQRLGVAKGDKGMEWEDIPGENRLELFSETRFFYIL